jgi:hypothetical protein
MKDPKKRHKPTGSVGPVRVKPGKYSTKVDFLPIQFPHSKAEIEKFIVKSFLSTVPPELLLAPFVDIIPNPENDFDFIDRGVRKPSYIELMEIAPLENIHSSYDKAPSSYNVYDFAENLLAKILAKSARYQVSRDTRLVLLTYITDWRFNLSEKVIYLLSYWTLTNQHAFTEIYNYKPRSASDGSGTRIFPTKIEMWINFKPDALRGYTVENLNPRELRSISDE